MISGDFRQILPVKCGATPAGILQEYLKKSPLWCNFFQLSLISNIRSAGHDACIHWLLDIGVGNTIRIPGLDEDVVEIPRDTIVLQAETLISTIFTTNIQNLTENQLAERIILCATNKDCLDINNKIIEDLAGNIHIYHSTSFLFNLTFLEFISNVLFFASSFIFFCPFGVILILNLLFTKIFNDDILSNFFLVCLVLGFFFQSLAHLFPT